MARIADIRQSLTISGMRPYALLRAGLSAVVAGLSISGSAAGQGWPHSPLEWQQGPHRVALEIERVGARPVGRGQLPVFLLLDGEQYQEQARAIARELASSGQLGPLILVSVKIDGDQEQLRLARLRLFTSAVPITDLPDRARNEGAATGEVHRFADRLRMALGKALANRGADRRCMTLFGHSLAGHAALAMALRPGREWRGIVAASPSIWWGRDSLLRDPNRIGRQSRDENLLLTAGALEATGESARRFRIVDNVQAFSRLAQSRFRSVELTIFPGEDHQSSVGPALRAGLVRAARCWRAATP